MKQHPFCLAVLLALTVIVAADRPASAQIYYGGGASPFGLYGPYVTRPFGFGGYYPGYTTLYGGYNNYTYPRVGMFAPSGSYYSYPYYPSYSYYRAPTELYGSSLYGSALYGGSGVVTPPYYDTYTPGASYYSTPAKTPVISNKIGQPASGVSSVKVLVPVADAEVWFGGVKTKQSGKSREFVTPPLEPGKKYKYQVRAVWNENGVEGEHNRTVEFQAGQSVVVDFTQPGLSEKQPEPEKKNTKEKM